MSELRVPLPPEMEPYKDDLEYFVATMVRKLHTNRHKGVGTNLDPAQMLLATQSEGNEAFRALAEEGQFEFGVECVDIANFAFLAARAAWDMTRKEYEQLRQAS
jgi:hypothetical protein